MVRVAGWVRTISLQAGVGRRFVLPLHRIQRQTMEMVIIMRTAKWVVWAAMIFDEIGWNGVFCECLRAWGTSEGRFRPSGGLQAHWSLSPCTCRCAISLGIRIRLCGSAMQDRSQSNWCSPRSFTWRMRAGLLQPSEAFSSGIAAQADGVASVPRRSAVEVASSVSCRSS